ncbi:MAG: hypothetical protein J7M34_06325 [Anaerolineae bacterium]|nr:hypothetical protein [Anaerolineae bacterium]
MGDKLDAFLLAVLLVARVRIDTLADLVLPTRHQDVARHPVLGHILSEKGMKLLADWLTDPLSLVLISIAFTGLVAYLLVDLMADRLRQRTAYRIKLALIWIIILVIVFAPTGKLILLRRQSGPASYTHDGGVIQTEAVIKFFLQGKNPYVENYLNTPMAEWGLDFRTALYHFPYLPWTFVFSTPFYLVSQAIIGWYDQRFVYLLLFALTLALVPKLASRARDRLILVMLLGLNPIMASDAIFGQNDSFILAWIVLSLWLWQRGRTEPAQNRRWWWIASAASYGLACASKPTAWFLAPFYALLLIDQERITWGDLPRLAGRILRRAAPGLILFLLLVLPYLLWNPAAMIDDVWRWSSGTAKTPYQIRGWGLANFVLALGLVESRLSYWPFWIPELIIALPILILTLARQMRRNELASACWGYGALLLGFLYASRFLNENYLGYILAFLALGAFASQHTPGRNAGPQKSPS